MSRLPAELPATAWARPADPAGPVRVVVISRDRCHLCVLAQEVVEQVCRDAGVAWAVTDVDADAETLAAWSDAVPVVLVDGVEIARYRVSAQVLAAALGVA